ISAETGVADARIEKLVNGQEAASGKNHLEADMRFGAFDVAEKFDLLIGAGRKVAVATFPRLDAIATAAPTQHGFSQSRPGGDERLGSLRSRRAGIDNVETGCGETRQRIARGFQIVEQDDLIDTQLATDCTLIDSPGQIGKFDAMVDDGAGYAESGG